LRRSKEETAQTRKNIVRAAAALIRREGLAEASIANVMAAAGLTHGGFYRHFQTRDQMLTEALALAGASSLDSIRGNLKTGGRQKAIASYLSKTQRNAKTPTCPLAALGSELSRADTETRSAATDTVTALIEALTDARGQTTQDSRDLATVDLATMVGALTLSRLVCDAALSEQILKSTLSRLTA